jgi:hypothetical protein
VKKEVMRAFLVLLLDGLKRLDLSPKAELGRYAMNRAIDVFIIGPACIVASAMLLLWFEDGSPLQSFAENFAEAGEMFRGAPAGFVYVLETPARLHFDALPHVMEPPLSREALAALPRKLIPVSEWVELHATALRSLYFAGVASGLIFIVLLRGFRVLAAPIAATKSSRSTD